MDMGLAVTVEPVVADKPVEGLQRYVLAPLAVNVVLLPAQIGSGVETDTFGIALTVAVTGVLVVDEHPDETFLDSA